MHALTQPCTWLHFPAWALVMGCGYGWGVIALAYRCLTLVLMGDAKGHTCQCGVAKEGMMTAAKCCNSQSPLPHALCGGEAPLRSLGQSARNDLRWALCYLAG